MSLISRPGCPVALRPISMGDLDAIMGWINDPAVTRNFAGLSERITREQEARFLQSMINSEIDRLYAVVDQEGLYLGNAGVHKIYWPARNGRLGIVLGAPGARGRGLGLHALTLLCDVGFGDLNLHKLWLQHYAINGRMAHLATQLGFNEEGRLREEYFHQGVYHDMVRRSLLKREWSTGSEGR